MNPYKNQDRRFDEDNQLYSEGECDGKYEMDSEKAIRLLKGMHGERKIKKLNSKSKSELVQCITELEAQVAECKEVLNEVLTTAMTWQDEEDYCPSNCRHTEICGNELIECLKVVLPIEAHNAEVE